MLGEASAVPRGDVMFSKNRMGRAEGQTALFQTSLTSLLRYLVLYVVAKSPHPHTGTNLTAGLGAPANFAAT